MAELVTCSRPGLLLHELCLPWKHSRRWKQPGDYHGKLRLEATPLSTNWLSS